MEKIYNILMISLKVMSVLTLIIITLNYKWALPNTLKLIGFYFGYFLMGVAIIPLTSVCMTYMMGTYDYPGYKIETWEFIFEFSGTLIIGIVAMVQFKQ